MEQLWNKILGLLKTTGLLYTAAKGQRQSLIVPLQEWDETVFADNTKDLILVMAVSQAQVITLKANDPMVMCNSWDAEQFLFVDLLFKENTYLRIYPRCDDQVMCIHSLVVPNIIADAKVRRQEDMMKFRKLLTNSGVTITKKMVRIFRQFVDTAEKAMIYVKIKDNYTLYVLRGCDCPSYH